MDDRDPRTLRLFDLGPSEAVVVRCRCGWIVEYPQGLLQRHHRVPSDMLIFDLQYRLRCKQCNRRDGSAIAIRDYRAIGSGGSPTALPVVIVEPKD